MIGKVAIKHAGGYDPNRPRKAKAALTPHRPKWDRVFKLLRECEGNANAGHVDLARSAATDAHKLSLMYIGRTPRTETSMGVAVGDIIDSQILDFLHKGDNVAFAHIEGVIASIKRVVAREAAQRAVSRSHARLRKTKHNRSRAEVDAVARQAIRDVRAELGSGAFGG